MHEHHARAALHHIYKNKHLPNTYIADFNLTWKDKDGEEHGSNFSDIFKFKVGVEKIAEVDMFEALK